MKQAGSRGIFLKGSGLVGGRRRKHGMTLAEARFGEISWALRFAGCFSLGNRGTENAMEKWCCRLHMVISVALLVAFDAWAFLGRALGRPGRADEFSQHVFLAMRIIFLVKVLVSWFGVLASSNRLQQLVHKASHFEITTGFVPPSVTVKRTARKILRQGALIILTVFFLARWKVFTDQHSQSFPLPSKAALSIVFTGASFSFAVCDSAYGRLLKCFGDIVLDYLKPETAHLVTWSKSARSYLEENSTLRNCKRNTKKIKAMLQEADDILKYVTTTGIACNLLIIISVLYAYTKRSTATGFLYMGTFYTALTVAELVDIGLLMDALRREACKMKWALESTSLDGLPLEIVRQIRFLHSGIEEDSLSFDGFGFFTVNLALLVHIAGSVITYTVILVQSSAEVSGRSAAATVGQSGIRQNFSGG